MGVEEISDVLKGNERTTRNHQRPPLPVNGIAVNAVSGCLSMFV
jgi:hypothetical protein